MPDGRARGRGRMVLLAAALCVVLAACGDSDEPAEEPTTEQTDAERWAAEVCGAVDAWRTDVETAVAGLAEDVGAAGSVDEALDVVAGSLDTIVEQSEAAADTISSSDPPETEAGDQLQAELDEVSDAISQTGTAVSEAQEATDQGLAQLATAIGNAATVAGQALSTVRDAWTAIGELDLGAEVSDAVAEDPTCQAIREG